MKVKLLKKLSDYSLWLVFILFLGYLFLRENRYSSFITGSMIVLITLHFFIFLVRVKHIIQKIQRRNRLIYYLAREIASLGLLASLILVISTESKWAIGILAISVWMAILVILYRSLQNRRIRQLKNQDLLDN
jgi:L-asparagine transporter-like permease